MSLTAKVGRDLHDVAVLGAHIVGGVGKVITTVGSQALENGQEHAHEIGEFHSARGGLGIRSSKRAEMQRTHVEAGTVLRPDRSLLSMSGSEHTVGKMKSKRNLNISSPSQSAKLLLAGTFGSAGAAHGDDDAQKMRHFSNPMMEGLDAKDVSDVDRMLGQIYSFVKTRPDIAEDAARVRRVHIKPAALPPLLASCLLRFQPCFCPALLCCCCCCCCCC